MIDERCSCVGQDFASLCGRWDEHALPTLTRLLKNGHRIDTKRLRRTKKLLLMLANKDPQAFSISHLGHSQHLPGCPLHRQQSVDDVAGLKDQES